MTRAFVVIDAPQRSDAWRLARVGRLTASRADDATRLLKNGGEPAARRDYRIQLCAERLTGQPCDSDFSNADMERGNLLEPDALAAYELATGYLVQAVDFLQHATVMLGYSPDGMVNAYEGLIEIKCPRPANHLKHIRSASVPAEHVAQITHALWLTGARWLDFVSYSPIFPEHLRLFIHRVVRDEAAIKDYAEKALVFLAEVDRETEAIATMANVGAVLREAATA